jgi:hypothetical protein
MGGLDLPGCILYQSRRQAACQHPNSTYLVVFCTSLDGRRPANLKTALVHGTWLYDQYQGYLNEEKCDMVSSKVGAVDMRLRVCIDMKSVVFCWSSSVYLSD